MLQIAEVKAKSALESAQEYLENCEESYSSDGQIVNGILIEIGVALELMSVKEGTCQVPYTGIRDNSVFEVAA